MTHRYSRAEKGKWTSNETRPERRRPVQIPNRDNSALIEENKLTLIGRVTNPAVQKTQWVVEWFLQFWNKLEMRLPIELPSGDIIKVNLEYEKLEKHCFLCYSLRHEKDSCPLNRDNTSIDLRNQGISQRNTLRKLDESRRIHDSRRSGTRSSKDREADSRDQQRFS
uniref:Zinc knuckle CX2CX4HX4C domain-containing protein n=1 Tax=Brassica oleracea TaxID=3712 RepID=A0A3P6F866_BRAOL|nr:unnamed protein product [Brassica oleracea]